MGQPGDVRRGRRQRFTIARGRWIVYRFEDHDAFALQKLRTDGRGHPQLILSPPTAPRFIDWGPR